MPETPVSGGGGGDGAIVMPIETGGATGGVGTDDICGGAGIDITLGGTEGGIGGGTGGGGGLTFSGGRLELPPP